MASSNGWFLTSAIKRVFEMIGTRPAISTTRSNRTPLRRKALFEGLEGRLLLSADPVGLTVPLDPVDTAPSAVTESLTDSSPAHATAPAVSGVPPITEVDSYEVDEDSVLVVDDPALGLLGNDSGGTGLKAILESGPRHGTLELNENGTFVYTPDPDYARIDGFTYVATDDSGATSESTLVMISVNGVGFNDPPVANDDYLQTAVDTPLSIGFEDLLGNDFDADEDTLQVSADIGKTPHGVLCFVEGVGYEYHPDAGFTGEDFFFYSAKDDLSMSSPAKVVILVKNVQPSNSPPVAQDDGYSTDEDTALAVAANLGLLANDSDADNDHLVAHLVSGPVHGELQILENGSFTYTPTANFNGHDSFTYKVSDGKAESAVATVSLQVKAVDDAPVFGSTPTTSFTIDADAANFDGDGVFRVAGAPGESVTVQLDWTYREALYNNEVGIYRVSGQDGRVGNLLPGDAGYAKAALAAGNAQVVFASGATTGAHLQLQLEGDAMYAFYVIQNGKTSTFLATNPDNKVGAGTLAFFSIAKGNPDGFDHVHAEIQPQTGTLNLRWEDLTKGGDADYNDVVMTAKGLAASSNDVMYVYDASAQDVDGDQLAYRLVDGPQGAYIDSKTGVLHWAAAAGVFHFVVQADDGHGGVTQQAFNLTVDTRSTDLVVKGTGGKDRIEVWEHDGGLVTVRVNDVARTYSHVSSLRVDALGGDDEVVLRSLTMKTTVDGGDGNDCIDASALTQIGVVLYGGAGNDRLTGGAGNDRMDGGSGDDELNGGCGNDVLVGGLGKDCLNGGDGNDLLDGGSDNDQLSGGKGNDLLIADAGDDCLKGEDGNDILVGGAGNDSSQGNYGADLIVDGPGCDSNGYVSSQDRVVDATRYGIPTTLPAQPSGPVVDWSSRYVALVASLQQFGDQPSNPQWWQDFVNNLGSTSTDANPNSRIRVVGPGGDS
jgi:VCBS repeat-containing protein